MLYNIANDPLNTGNSLNIRETLGIVEKNGTVRNPYAKSAEFDDSIEISEKAKALFEKDKDIEKYKNLVLESPITSEEMNAIMKMIQSGEFIDNKELADIMLKDNEFADNLFAPVEAVS